MKKLTRDDLIKMIYKSDYCPNYSCDENACMECAEKALEEYEQSIREEKQEPCGDAISRQAALDAFWNGEPFPKYLQIAPPVKLKKAEEPK